MRKFVWICVFAALASFQFINFASADELDQGKALVKEGKLLDACEFFNQYVVSHPDDKKKTPEAYAWCGRILDAMADSLTEQAEKRCYWNPGSPKSPACMEGEASKFNSKYGDGAFRYEHNITYINYTGSHYKKIREKFPNSEYAAEADFYLLLRDLAGHPDTVLPKIKAFLKSHSKGEWYRRGLLLWARINEDIWYIHRKWSWVLYNSAISEDELIVRAEPYRREALRTFDVLRKDAKTREGQIAQREYDLLKANGEDKVTYGIVTDATPGTLSDWGIDVGFAKPQLPQGPKTK